MLEYKQWEKSKLKLSTIKFSAKKNPIRIMVDYLKKERNKLMSRRIFRPATIQQRITIRQDFTTILNNCNLTKFQKTDIMNLAETIENIIYSLSSKPKSYTNYVTLVKSNYKVICELVDGSLLTETEPQVIIPVITEFIIKEGDIRYINIERLNNILKILESKEDNLLLKLLETLRYKELVAYRASLIEEQNKEPTDYKLKLVKVINDVIDANKLKKKEEMYSIAANTYIAPVITNIVQNSNGQNRFYVPEYHIVGENEYLYGGNYPDFVNYATGERIIQMMKYFH